MFLPTVAFMAIDSIADFLETASKKAFERPGFGKAEPSYLREKDTAEMNAGQSELKYLCVN